MEKDRVKGWEEEENIPDGIYLVTSIYLWPPLCVQIAYHLFP